MKLRSILSLVLVLVMAASVIAACGKDAGTGGGTTTAATTTSTTSGTTTQTVQEKPVLDLTIHHWALSNFDPATDDFAKLVSEKFKVNIKAVVFEDDQQLKLAAASQSLPDVFDFGVLYDVPTYNQWISQGIVRDIPEDMLNKFPNTKALCENTSTWVASKELNNNKIWYIARTTSTDPTIFKTGWTGYYYRKDWLANVGITKPIETWDEFYQAMKAFKENDPDQDGAADTSGVTCNTAWMMIDSFSAWGLNCEDWVSEGGKWIPGYLSDKAIEPLKYWNKLFNEGLIDPEFGNNTAQQAMQKFAGHNFGAIIRNADTWWIWNVIVNQFGNANKDLGDPLELITVSNNFKLNANSQPMYVERCDPDGVMFRADLPDEKLERYLEIHEWMTTEEANLYSLGFEGKEYTKDASGKIVTFNDPDTGKPYDIAKRYPATGMLTLVSWRFENALDPNWPDTTIRAPIKEIARKNMEERDPYPLKQNIKLRLVSTPSKNLAVDADFGTEYALIIMSKDPVETTFAQAKEKLLATGIQGAIDEVNAAAAQLGINP